jgi:hypothetical protein
MALLTPNGHASAVGLIVVVVVGGCVVVVVEGDGMVVVVVVVVVGAVVVVPIEVVVVNGFVVEVVGRVVVVVVVVTLVEHDGNRDDVAVADGSMTGESARSINEVTATTEHRRNHGSRRRFTSQTYNAVRSSLATLYCREVTI